MLIYLIAGEPSGDLLGARLMRAIRRRRPDARFAGIGGTAMAAEGCASLFPMSDLSRDGIPGGSAAATPTETPHPARPPTTSRRGAPTWS